MTVKHLTQTEVARRWCLSPRTLERWRWLGQGPAFLKLGGRVAYRLEDIEAFEAAQTSADYAGATSVSAARRVSERAQERSANIADAAAQRA
jgi:hypothetical protein